MKPQRAPVYLVDDDEVARTLYKSVLERHGIGELLLFEDAAHVLRQIPVDGCSLIILDLHMPQVSGQEILKQVRAEHPEVPVIVVTGDETIDTAVECMKLGAFDYLRKPVEHSRLWASVRHALEIVELQREVGSLGRRIQSGTLAHPEAFAGVITQSEAMRSIFSYVEAVAPTSRPILVTGESGTGKELLARAVHNLSRREGPFLAVNAAGLDDTMFSDALFGHVRGAYTGAEGDRPGFVEKAAEGTLFLDEIGDLPPSSQVKLLRLLQEGEYYPLGSDRARSSSARIVAATNADLQDKQGRGQFRKDLYFRLIGHHVEVPPLRERFEDLPLLVEHFLAAAAAELKTVRPAVPPGLYALLETHAFPGNVRELQSVLIDALSSRKGGTLALAPIKAYLDKQRGTGRGAAAPVSSPRPRISYSGRFPTLREAEDFLVAAALEKSGGNQSLAAQLLGVNQSTLSRRQKQKKALPKEG